MIFKGPPTISVWSSGGEIRTREGPANEARIRSLVTFYEATASRCLAKGDTHGARFCQAMLLQIGDACAQAAQWARASGPERRAA